MKARMLAAWFASVTTALTAQDDAATQAVQRLADARTRDQARQQLLALAAAAVPALEVAIGDADVEFMSAALSVLDELGPVAGRSMSRVLDLYDSSVLRGPRALETLVELAPWRPRDGSLEWEQIERACRRARESEGREKELWERLRLRCLFSRDADVPTLIAVLRSRNPWRAEIAIQLLGARGPEAAPALSALQLVLERPEPRVLSSGECVPLHRRAAVAVLAMSPPRALAELARERLAGRGPAVAAPRDVSPRLRARVDELVADLGDPAKRAAAVTNLLAIGEAAAPLLAASLKRKPGSEVVAAELAVLTQLGKRAAAATPELIAALPSIPAEHAAAALQVLAIMAPWWNGVVQAIEVRQVVRGCVALDGVQLEGTVDGATYLEIATAAKALNVALSIDPESTIAELGQLLANDDPFVRVRALALLEDRGRDAGALLPAIAKLMRPPAQRRALVFGKDPTPMVRAAAARAIVALAPPGDPLVAEARELLGEPPPK